jgi:hypothetical protein
MLQTINKHLRLSKGKIAYEVVDSVEYRNLAPLYCDEEMRVCVKKKKSTDTGGVWDVWIEGPTGGMAVKAVVRTVYQKEIPSLAERATKKAPAVEPILAASLPQSSAQLSTEQTPELSRRERRKAWRSQQRSASSPALAYLYAVSSPLVARTSSPSSQQTAEQPSKVRNKSKKAAQKPFEKLRSLMLQQRGVIAGAAAGSSASQPKIHKVESTAPEAVSDMGNIFRKQAVHQQATTSPTIRKVDWSRLSDSPQPSQTQAKSLAQTPITASQPQSQPAEASEEKDGFNMTAVETTNPEDGLSVTDFQKRMDAGRIAVKKVEVISIRKVGRGLKDRKRGGNKNSGRSGV